MKRRILVATDGSEAADRAVDYAAALAKREGADLLIANVVGGYGLPDGVFTRLIDAKQASVKEMLELDIGRNPHEGARAGAGRRRGFDPARTRAWARSPRRSSTSQRRRRSTRSSSANAVPDRSSGSCSAACRASSPASLPCR